MNFKMRVGCIVVFAILLASPGCQTGKKPDSQLRVSALERLKKELLGSYNIQANQAAGLEADALGQALSDGVEELNSNLSGIADSMAQNYNVPIWVNRYLITQGDIDFRATCFDAQLRIIFLSMSLEKCAEVKTLEEARFIVGLAKSIPQIHPTNRAQIHGQIIEAFWTVERSRGVINRIKGDPRFANEGVPNAKLYYRNFLTSRVLEINGSLGNQGTADQKLKSKDACLRAIAIELSKAQVVSGALEQAGIFNSTFITQDRFLNYRESFTGPYDGPRNAIRSTEDKNKFHLDKFQKDIFTWNDFDNFRHSIAISTQRAYNGVQNDYATLADNPNIYSKSKHVGAMDKPDFDGAVNTNASGLTGIEKAGDFVDAGFIVADTALISGGLLLAPGTYGASLAVAGVVVSVLESGKLLLDITVTPQIAAQKASEFTDELRSAYWNKMLFGRDGNKGYLQDAFIRVDELWGAKS